LFSARDKPHWQKYTPIESERMKNDMLSKWKPKASRSYTHIRQSRFKPKLEEIQKVKITTCE
jgi:hypothetical protein